ncbi:hypothetical protein [Streptomyces sp. NPDC047061]|uniref:hypothetical protein n=1 Tax=Streptomyces sp. NPDC047061 TaxID=3154605 RepID=UPI0033C99D60
MENIVLDQWGVPAGGSCHLMAAEDGWVATNLARPDDEASLEFLAVSMAARADALAVSRATPC